jgi:hypothetical protein
MAARLMRHLVDHARRKQTDKRGGGVTMIRLDLHQQAAGTRWVRLALPVGIELRLASEQVSHAFSLLMADKASIALLKPGPANAGGWLGELTRHYIPV